MEKIETTPFWQLLGARYKSHPWHGIEPGNADKLTCFIEVVPQDTVKYEVDKTSGFLMIDRPQKFSNIMPALYGFVPRTYCAEEVASYSIEKTGDTSIVGDGDPLDVVVLTERSVSHGDILVHAKIVGGFRMIDGGEADDKVIAVLNGDSVYGDAEDIKDIPEPVLKRLLHYFLTYKQTPHGKKPEVEITHTYGKEEAVEVLKRSKIDYKNHYGELEEALKDKFLKGEL